MLDPLLCIMTLLHILLYPDLTFGFVHSLSQLQPFPHPPILAACLASHLPDLVQIFTTGFQRARRHAGQGRCWSQAKSSLELLEGVMDEDMPAEAGCSGAQASLDFV